MASARERVTPTVPTAMQNDVVVHDTPLSMASPRESGRIDQLTPFHVSTTVVDFDPLKLKLCPTAIQNDPLVQDTEFKEGESVR
jgi:hypothetical protein